jgi:hypothetical protein
MRSIIHPATGMSFVVGSRIRPVYAPKFFLSDYVKAEPPVIELPPSTNHFDNPAVQAVLKKPLGNLTKGDCVPACFFHGDGVACGDAGSTTDFVTDENAIGFYERACGYKPGDPRSDQGCDQEVALQYWEQHGLLKDGSHKIVGRLAVDATSPVAIKTAIFAFTFVCIGMELPDAYVNPPPSADGFMWGVAGSPDPNNGHEFVSFDYDVNGNLAIGTWGMNGLFTPQAAAMYCIPSANGAIDVVLTQDVINAATQKAPNLLDWQQLQADFVRWHLIERIGAK